MTKKKFLFESTPDEIEAELWRIFEDRATRDGLTVSSKLYDHAAKEFGGNIKKSIFDNVSKIQAQSDDKSRERYRLYAAAKKCAAEAGKSVRAITTRENANKISRKNFDAACEKVREKYKPKQKSGGGPICP